MNALVKRRPLMIAREFTEAFWAEVNRKSDCWQWRGSVTSHGHGQVRISKNQRPLASRVAWEMMHGPLPPNTILVNTCFNRTCVRPEHQQLAPSGSLALLAGKSTKRNAELEKLFTTPFIEVSQETSDDDESTCPTLAAMPLALPSPPLSPDIIRALVRSTMQVNARLETFEERFEVIEGRLGEVLEDRLGALAEHVDDLRAALTDEQLPKLDAIMSALTELRTAPPTPALGASSVERWLQAVLGCPRLEREALMTVTALALHGAEGDAAAAVALLQTWVHMLETRVADGSAAHTGAALCAIAQADLRSSARSGTRGPSAP